MKKTTLFTMLTLCLVASTAALGVAPGGGQGNQREAGYRIMYKNCSLDVSPEMNLLVSGATGDKSSLKIQWMKKMPADVALNENGISSGTPGVAYLADGSAIPEIRVADGNLCKIYSEAMVGALLTSGSVKFLTTKDAHVEYIEAGTLGFVKMWSQSDSSDSGYALCSIVTTKTGTLKVHLTGIILENLITAQEVQSLKVDSKKAKKSKKAKDLKPPTQPGAGGPKGVSLGGLGRVTPEALVDAESTYVVIAAGIQRIQTKGASVSPDLILSEKAINMIQAKPAKYTGVEIGGFIGQSDETTTPTTVVAPNMNVLYGQVGVAGVFIAGANAEGAPDYSGAIKTIATKPRTGTLSGEAHISPTAKPIKFKPEQGDFFDVFTAPPLAP